MVTKHSYLRLLLILLSGMLFISTYDSCAQANEKIISGRVIDTISFKPLPDMVVVNKRSNKVTITDKEGLFYIVAKITDTLFIYSVGYFPKILSFKNQKDFEKQFQGVYLKPNIEELEQVQITGSKRREKKEYKYAFNQQPATIQSPLTFLYERHSKKYQQYAKIQELERKKYYERLRESRYNRAFIMDITDIKEEEIDAFLKRYKFSDEFIEKASDYDLIVAIQKNYRNFKADK